MDFGTKMILWGTKFLTKKCSENSPARTSILWVRQNPTKLPPNFPQDVPQQKIKKKSPTTCWRAARRRFCPRVRLRNPDLFPLTLVGKNAQKEASKRIPSKSSKVYSIKSSDNTVAAVKWLGIPVRGEISEELSGTYEFPRKRYGPMIGPYEFPLKVVWTNGAQSSLKVSVLTGYWSIERSSLNRK